MSLDLALLPVREWRGGQDATSYSVLECDLGGALSEILRDLPEREPVPDAFYHFQAKTEDGARFGKAKRDAFGDVIQVVPAMVLARRLDEHIAEVDTPQNRAALAYVKALEPETRIGLYWH